jgi:hypothetical protein
MYGGEIKHVLAKCLVKTSRNRWVFMKNLMEVDEPTGVCKVRTKWKKVIYNNWIMFDTDKMETVYAMSFMVRK